VQRESLSCIGYAESRRELKQQSFVRVTKRPRWGSKACRLNDALVACNFTGRENLVSSHPLGGSVLLVPLVTNLPPVFERTL
jgi:hypothetical protein